MILRGMLMGQRVYHLLITQTNYFPTKLNSSLIVEIMNTFLKNGHTEDYENNADDSHKHQIRNPPLPSLKMLS